LRGKIVLYFILGFPAVFFAAAGIRAIDIARSGPVPNELRDLDCDGHVGAIEWLRAGLDYELRDAGQGCTAVVHVKTGHAVVYRCNTEPRCRTARQWDAAASNR
jgi:hypothetical protein